MLRVDEYGIPTIVQGLRNDLGIYFIVKLFNGKIITLEPSEVRRFSGLHFNNTNFDADFKAVELYVDKVVYRHKGISDIYEEIDSKYRATYD
jgi:hypothetical protein